MIRPAHRSGTLKTTLVMLAVIRTLLSGQDRGGPGSRLYVDYSAAPDAAQVLKHDFCILDPQASIDLTPGHKLGHQYLAYVSAVEVDPNGASVQAARKREVPFIAKNAGWQTEVMDVTSRAWADFIVEDLAAPAIAKGYDGIFLDTLDSVELITRAKPFLARPAHVALLSLIQRLHERFPGKRIVLNRGFPLIKEASPMIHGVLIEGLYQTWDMERQRFNSTSPEGTTWLLEHIRTIRQLRLPLYVIDYVDPADDALAKRTSQRIRTAGGIPFISTPALQGTVSGTTASAVPSTPQVHAQH